jgi:hypothetical protein
MDKKYLHKVLDQLVSETEIDDSEVVRFPFPPYSFPTSLVPSLGILFFFFSSFPKHCRDIYGLNKDEIEYVWNEYRDIVKDKIRNNGL